MAHRNYCCHQPRSEFPWFESCISSSHERETTRKRQVRKLSSHVGRYDWFHGIDRLGTAISRSLLFADVPFERASITIEEAFHAPSAFAVREHVESDEVRCSMLLLVVLVVVFVRVASGGAMDCGSKIGSALLTLAIACALAACGLYTPDKDPFTSDAPAGPDHKYTRQGSYESGIVDHITCEVSQALAQAADKYSLPWLYKDWGTAVTLSITVEDQTGLKAFSIAVSTTSTPGRRALADRN
jgi:hypothetical protein